MSKLGKRLIAAAEEVVALQRAAPDLLAELKNMLEIYWGDGDGELPEPDCIIRAKAAIAKAEGK